MCRSECRTKSVGSFSSVRTPSCYWSTSNAVNSSPFALASEYQAGLVRTVRLQHLHAALAQSHIARLRVPTVEYPHGTYLNSAPRRLKAILFPTQQSVLTAHNALEETIRLVLASGDSR